MNFQTRSDRWFAPVLLLRLRPHHWDDLTLSFLRPVPRPARVSVKCRPVLYVHVLCSFVVYATADEADAYMFYRWFFLFFFRFFRSPQKYQTTVHGNG